MHVVAGNLVMAQHHLYNSTTPPRWTRKEGGRFVVPSVCARVYVCVCVRVGNDQRKADVLE